MPSEPRPRRRLPIAAALSLPVVGTIAGAAGVVGAEPRPVLVDRLEPPAAAPAVPSAVDGVALITGPDETVAYALSLPAPARAAAAGDPVAAMVEIPDAVDGVPAIDAFAAFWDAGYDYETLVALAEEWQVPELEAKARAGAAILNGDQAIIAQIEAAAALVGDDPVPADATARAADAFWDAGYGYDTAVVLAEEWRIDTFEAKVRAGEAILAGDAAVIAEIEAAAAEAAIADPGATAADPAAAPVDLDGLYFARNMREWRAMEALAEEWQVDVLEVKARLGAMPTAEADGLVGRR